MYGGKECISLGSHGPENGGGGPVMLTALLIRVSANERRLSI
jgi:hypothetical protein